MMTDTKYVGTFADSLNKQMLIRSNKRKKNIIPLKWILSGKTPTKASFEHFLRDNAFKTPKGTQWWKLGADKSGTSKRRYDHNWSGVLKDHTAFHKVGDHIKLHPRLQGLAFLNGKFCVRLGGSALPCASPASPALSAPLPGRKQPPRSAPAFRSPQRKTEKWVDLPDYLQPFHDTEAIDKRRKPNPATSTKRLLTEATDESQKKKKRRVSTTAITAPAAVATNTTTAGKMDRILYPRTQQLLESPEAPKAPKSARRRAWISEIEDRLLQVEGEAEQYTEAFRLIMVHKGEKKASTANKKKPTLEEKRRFYAKSELVRLFRRPQGQLDIKSISLPDAKKKAENAVEAVMEKVEWVSTDSVTVHDRRAVWSCLLATYPLNLEAQKE